MSSQVSKACDYHGNPVGFKLENEAIVIDKRIQKTVKIKKSTFLCYKVRMDESDVIISSTEIIKGKFYIIVNI